MKKNILFLSIGVISMLPIQGAFSMGRFFTESVETSIDAAPEAVSIQPTEEAKAIVYTIDKVGDIAAAAGVPFAGFAGEIAVGLLGLASTVLTMLESNRRGRALKTVAKGVERGTTDGTIKSEILKQSVKDRTTATIQRAVAQVT